MPDEMYDLRDLAETFADPELDNDEFIALHGLFSQLCGSEMPDDPMGPVSDEVREQMADAARSVADDDPTLIRDDGDDDGAWLDYVRELVMDCGYFAEQPASPYGAAPAIDWDRWPYRCIDWPRVARELRDDYTIVTYHGVDYLTRQD